MGGWNKINVEKVSWLRMAGWLGKPQRVGWLACSFQKRFYDAVNENRALRLFLPLSYSYLMTENLTSGIMRRWSTTEDVALFTLSSIQMRLRVLPWSRRCWANSTTTIHHPPSTTIHHPCINSLPSAFVNILNNRISYGIVWIYFITWIF